MLERISVNFLASQPVVVKILQYEPCDSPGRTGQKLTAALQYVCFNLQGLQMYSVCVLAHQLDSCWYCCLAGQTKGQTESHHIHTIVWLAILQPPNVLMHTYNCTFYHLIGHSAHSAA